MIFKAFDTVVKAELKPYAVALEAARKAARVPATWWQAELPPKDDDVSLFAQSIVASTAIHEHTQVTPREPSPRSPAHV